MVVLITYLLQYEAVWRNISCLTRAAAFAVRENSGKILLNVYNHIVYNRWFPFSRGDFLGHRFLNST